MALVLYDTAAREKRVFTPITPGAVGMYVCGPTVWDYAHIGNARPVVVFDVLYRYFREQDYVVTYVRNITDVDDKIIAAHEKSGEPMEVLTGRFAKIYAEDMAALGALEPTVTPRATEHIPQMIAMIGKLIEADHAYVADGHVLFDVTSLPSYGELSGRNRDDMIAGARVEVAPYKKDPADFVLWKPAGEHTGWDSPWGKGRPGWHIECSAMSEAYLGETFDIHGGGLDLIFPHHENEIAQSRCAHDGKILANFWMHNGFLTVDKEKMSKSLGNFFTVHEVLQKWPGEVIRYFMLSTHYRAPLNWTEDGLEQAKRSLDRLYLALRNLDEIEAQENVVPEEVLSAIEDDLNTPRALAALHALAKEANKATDLSSKQRLKGELLWARKGLGLLRFPPKRWLRNMPIIDVDELRSKMQQHGIKRVFALATRDVPGSKIPKAIADEEINTLIEERAEARKAKDFARADKIRTDLESLGIILEDGPGGTTWRRA